MTVKNRLEQIISELGSPLEEDPVDFGRQLAAQLADVKQPRTKRHLVESAASVKRFFRSEYAEPSQTDFHLIEIRQELMTVSVQLERLQEQFNTFAYGGFQSRNSSHRESERTTAFCVELYAIFARSASDDWDDEGGRAIAPETIEATRVFVSQLPLIFPLPEITADPDGGVMLDWWGSPGESVTIVVGPGEKVVYAALFGESSVRGMETSIGNLPEAAIAILLRLYREEISKRRTSGG